MKRLLVTGGSGLVGRHLLPLLASAGAEVLCLTRDDSRLFDVPKSIRWIRCDLNDLSDLAAVLSGLGAVDGIIHMAAAIPYRGHETPATSFQRINVAATRSLLEYASGDSGSRSSCPFVFSSSIGVIRSSATRGRLDESSEYVAAPHPYFQSKIDAERLCEEFRLEKGVSAFSVRLSSVYGRGMNRDLLLPTFVQLALKGNELRTYGTGKRMQGFIHAIDAGRLLVAALESDLAGGIYNAPATMLTVRELAEMAVETLDSSSPIVAANRPESDGEEVWSIGSGLVERTFSFVGSVPIADGITDLARSLGERLV